MQSIRTPGRSGRLLLAMAFLGGTHFAQAQSAPDFTPVTTRVERLVAAVPLQGASVRIVRNGEVIYQRAFGSYGLERRVAIASATKWLSGAVLARLVDRGVMRWDDTIGRYLPNAPVAKRGITLRQLFSHSSGLPGSEIGCIGDANLQFQSCVDQILAVPLAYNPGQGFSYGGNSMHVAGRLAEIATGKRWDDLFREEVAVPLGMPLTDYAVGNLTPGYVEVSNPRIAGGGRSVLADYSNFVQAMLARGVVGNRQWLSPGIVDQMMEDQSRGAPVLNSPFPESVGYGIGEWVERSDSRGRALLVSSGGAFGFYPVVDREAGFAGVFLVANLMDNVKTEVQAMWADVRNILLTQAPQSPSLQVQAGYGSGAYAAGTSRQIFAEAAGSQRLFERWLGDAPLLGDARAWDARFTTPNRASSLTAQFTAVAPMPTPTSDIVNGARYLSSIAPGVRGLIFSFHGSGGSGDLPFSRYVANEATRRYLAHGFGIVGLDSADRVNRQWNPAFALTNPDVVNVQAIIDRLRAAGTVGANTPIFCEGTSNGGAFCSRVSALLGFRAQSLVIADGIGAVLAQSSVPTIWSLARNDATLAPGYLERATASQLSFAARGIASELNVLEPSPIYPERFARIPGITLADSGSITASLRSAGLIDPAGNLAQNPSAELLATLLPAALRSYSSDLKAEIENAWSAHQYIGNFAHRTVHFFEAQLAVNYTGLWWKADEPGWGLSLAHQGDTLFPTWYTYQADGKPAWFSGGALVRQSDGAYRGPAYRVTGQPFNVIAGPVLTQATEVGTFELRPRSDGALDFSYVIGAVSQTRRIERTRFGELPQCRFLAGSRAAGSNRSDIWWNPREAGWGLSLAEQDQTIALTWYTYATDGSPTWVLGTLTRDAEGRFVGALVRPLGGSAFSQVSGPATAFPVPTVGTAEIEFTDGELAIFRYTLDGIAQAKDIERFVFAGPGISDCQ